MTDIDEKQVNDILQKLSNKSEALKITMGSLIDDEMNTVLTLVQTLWKKIQEDTGQIAGLQKQIFQYKQKEEADKKEETPVLDA